MMKLKTCLVSSMEKVFADHQGAFSPHSEQSVLMGERAGFQLAYHWSEEPCRAQVSVETELEGVSVRTVELEPAEYAAPSDADENFCRTAPGLYPDILMPYVDGIRLMPNQWRALWISAEGQTKSGRFPVTIRITAGDEVLSEDTFVLDIIKAELPKQKLIYTQWLHTDCLAEWYEKEVFSDEWWEIVEKYIDFAAKRGQNMLLTPLFTPPLDTLVGAERMTVQLVEVMHGEDGWSFEFSRLGRWLEMCGRCGIEYIECSHLFTQWGAEHAPKIIAWDKEEGVYRKVFGWDTEAGGEDYAEFLSAFIPQLQAYFDECGWGERVYYHISDEPSGHHVEQYGRLSRMVHCLIGNRPVMDALSDYDFYRKGYVDIPVCATEHIDPYLENNASPLWAYYCGCHNHGVSNRLLAMPGSRCRCIGLQLYESGVQGFLHWGYNFWRTQYSVKRIDPYKVSDAGGAFNSGDSFSVYPGEEGPIAAVSLELFGDGLQDLRALELAESLCGREAVREIYKDCRWSSFHICPSDSKEVDTFREKLNELIRKNIRHCRS